jgi:16S rRNA (cytosine1402-N4)-methyltransferase
MAPSERHVPVMPDRVLALLAPAIQVPGAVLVDATLGLGGHAESALGQFPDLRLIGIDRDTSALDLTRARLAPFGSRATLVHAVYDELPEVLQSLGFTTVQGILFDLGVSSMQLDDTDRGFAYSVDAPLDMRMDQSSGLTAADVLNTYEAGALVRVLREYGEERFASRIASRIVRERTIVPFTNSGRLVELIRDSIPAATRRTGGNPAKRTFQALRIEVNGELAVLERAIPAALDSLAVGGRIVVMAYQSLEDRIVKRALAEGARVRAPHGLPVIPESMQPWLRLITRGAEKPTEAELAENPRSASVRVRAAERLAVAA